MAPQSNIPVGKGQRAALTYFRDELDPVIAELQSLAEAVAGFQVGFLESFRRNRLRKLEERYAQSMARFMAAYRKWHSPDEMLKEIEASNMTDALKEYMRIKPSLSEHIQEGFRVLGFIDRLIGGARSVADNRVAVILSMIAITVSIIVAVI